MRCLRERAGEGAATFQARGDEKDEALSTSSVDYGFFGTPGQSPLTSVAGKDLPVLVGYDRKSKAVLAHLWPRVAGAAPASSVSAVAAGALALPRAGARGGRVSAAHGGSERHRTLR